jgi:hypothetical protein
MSEQFEQNQMRIKHILRELQSQVNELVVAVRDITATLAYFQDTIPKAIHIVSNLAARLLLTKYRLYDVSLKWKEGIVDQKILEIFNITLPYDCDLSLAQPKSCRIDEIRLMVSIEFEVHSKRNNTSIMEADPFTLYISKSDNLCAINYFGPRIVVYDSKNDCVTALHQITKENRNLILMPSSAKCQKNLPESMAEILENNVL